MIGSGFKEINSGGEERRVNGPFYPLPICNCLVTAQETARWVLFLDRRISCVFIFKPSILPWYFFTGNSLLLKTVTQSNKLLITEASNLISGTLKLAVSCVGPYTLQVTGSSPLDFTYQLLDVEDLELGTTRRVVGNPLRGKGTCK